MNSGKWNKPRTPLKFTLMMHHHLGTGQTTGHPPLRATHHCGPPTTVVSINLLTELMVAHTHTH